MLDAEKEEKMMERESTLKERVPPLKLAGLSVKELQVGVPAAVLLQNCILMVHRTDDLHP